ncbi:tetratricopeptide repeat protein [bacterium]|nr:tetratricopeptide repeat protein [bacterium]
MNQLKNQRWKVCRHLYLCYIAAVFIHSCSLLPNLKPAREGSSELPDSIKVYDSRAIEHFMAGENHTMQGDYAMAVLEYQDALNYDSTSYTIYVSMAKAFINLGKFERGIEALNRALRLEPDDLEAREILAQVYFLSGDNENAEKEYETLRNANRDDLELYYQLAAIYIKNRKLDKAVQLYEEIYQADPGQLKALEKAAEISLIRQDLNQAANLYDTLIRQKPENMDYYKYRADIAIVQKDIPRALGLYETLIELAPGDVDILERFGDLLSRSERFEDACIYLQDLIQKYPDRESAYISLTFVYSKNKDFDLLYRFVDSAMVRFPEQPFFPIITANTLNNEKYHKKAEVYLIKALEIDPENLQAQILLANTWEILRQYKLSDSLYTLIISNNPDEDVALNNFAYSLALRSKQLEKALKMVSKALEISADNASYLDTKGWILYKLGKPKEAKEYVEKALSIQNDNAEVLEHMGDILTKLKKTVKAKEYYRRALEFDPENEGLKQKLSK